MNRKSKISRTIQYWRLVDSRTGSWVEDYDWDGFLRQCYAKSAASADFVVGGIPLSGKIHSVQPPKYRDLVPVFQEAVPERELDAQSAFILVLSSSKDFTPNQKSKGTGEQSPMGLNGEDWEPVDNLFVYHLPFANIIAVMAESVSSRRAKVYSEWLNFLMLEEGKLEDNPDFRWVAEPVMDPEAIAKIQKSTGLKSVVISGEMGNEIATQFPSKAAIFGPRFDKRIDGIRVEIKVTTIRGKGSREDEESLNEWYRETFGDFGDAEHFANKARVVARNDGDFPSYTEVDLLEQRVTRKQVVELSQTGAAVINYESAIEAILDAVSKDLSTLVELRN